MFSDRITIITVPYSNSTLSTLYTVPANHSFMLYSKEMTGTATTYRLSDNNGITTVLTQDNKRENLREWYSAGEYIKGQAVNGGSGDIILRGILIDGNNQYVPYVPPFVWGTVQSFSLSGTGSSSIDTVYTWNTDKYVSASGYYITYYEWSGNNQVSIRYGNDGPTEWYIYGTGGDIGGTKAWTDMMDPMEPTYDLTVTVIS